MAYGQARRLSIFMVVVPVVLLPALAKAVPPQVGERAPALDLEKLLQAPEGAKADWESLRGKVVVLDFWATWCVPCVRDIPFLNKLQDAFKDKPVQFIAVTDEPKSIVGPFLKKNPIKGWIGLDADGSAFKAYAVLARPTAVVVDQQGRLVGWTIPSTLVDHPDILDDLIAGKPRNLGGPASLRHPDMLTHMGLDIDELVGTEQNRPLCVIVIRPAQPIERKALANSGSASFYSEITLRSAITSLYDVAWHDLFQSK